MTQQMAWNRFRPAVTPGLVLDDEVGGVSGHRRDRLTHRREFRPYHGRDGRIVEPRDRQLPWEIEAELSRHGYRRRGHVVIARENGRRRRRRPQHSLRAHQSIGKYEVARLHQTSVHGCLMSPHLVHETEISLFLAPMILPPSLAS